MSDAVKLQALLRQTAGYASEAWPVIAKQVRYRLGGVRGAGERALPANLSAAARYAAIGHVTTSWARRVARLQGVSAPTASLGPVTNWLADQVVWLRTRKEAVAAFEELTDAALKLELLIDRPADRMLIGVCDCGQTLYAHEGRSTVKCRAATCALVWDVERSRDILRESLGDRLVTLPEAARLAAYLDADRTQDGVRKLLAGRVAVRRLVAHGELDGAELYRFGEVVAVLAEIPKRERRPRSLHGVI